MNIWLPILLSAAMLAVSLATFARSSRRDHNAEAAERAKMSADLSYIRASVDDIRAEGRITRNDLKSLESRVSRAEASISSAHHRLDDYLKGVHGA